MLVVKDGLPSWPIIISSSNIDVGKAMLRQMPSVEFHGQIYYLTMKKWTLIWSAWIHSQCSVDIIKYRCGQSNVEADALSRISWPNILSDNEEVDIDLECMDTQSIQC